MLLSKHSADTYEYARSRAAREEWWLRLTRRSVSLLPFISVQHLLGAQHARYGGLADIPLDRIVGSVGRPTDFTRSFWPRRAVSQSRWRMIDDLFHRTGFEPVSVYLVGDLYFVHDGHHRISVARAHGLPTIEAYVSVYPAPQQRQPLHARRVVNSRGAAA